MLYHCFLLPHSGHHHLLLPTAAKSLPPSLTIPMPNVYNFHQFMVPIQLYYKLRYVSIQCLHHCAYIKIIHR